MSKKVKRLDAPRFHWKLGLIERQRVELVRQLREDCPAYYPAIGGQWAFARTEIPYQELWARVHWTPDAAQMIRAGEYRYISAEFDLDHRDVANGNRIGAALTAVGLTNRPFVKGMAEVEQPDGDSLSWVQILATGEWHHPVYGKIIIEPKHLTEMRRNVQIVQASIRAESEHPDTDLMVDYNHGSLMTSDPEGGKAAGWITGENLVVRAALQASELPLLTEETEMLDEQIRKLLHLTSEVELTDEHRALADGALDELIALRDTPTVEPSPEEEAPAATADPPEVVQLRDEGAVGIETLKNKARDLGLEFFPDSAGAVKQLVEMKAKDIVRLAIEARQVTPAQRAWAEQYALSDIKGFTAYLKATGPLVPLGREGANGEDHREEPEQIRSFMADLQKNSVALDEAQRQALKKFGEQAFADYRNSNKKEK